MTTTYPPKTRTCSVKWITDPGHAWCAVNASLIRELKIADQISSFSYLSRGIAYLEEDCDAPRFFHAANLAGFEITTEKEQRHTGNAPVRRMARFTEYAQNYSETPLF